MPRISDHVSDFLDSTMVKTGDVVVILDKGMWISPEESGFDKWAFHVQVSIPDKREKTWSMNKTTMKALSPVYGDNTETWIGKEVAIEVTRQKTPGGMKDVLYGSPVEAKPKDPTSTQLK